MCSPSSSTISDLAVFIELAREFAEAERGGLLDDERWRVAVADLPRWGWQDDALWPTAFGIGNV